MAIKLYKGAEEVPYDVALLIDDKDIHKSSTKSFDVTIKFKSKDVTQNHLFIDGLANQELILIDDLQADRFFAMVVLVNAIDNKKEFDPLSATYQLTLIKQTKSYMCTNRQVLTFVNQVPQIQESYIWGISPLVSGYISLSSDGFIGEVSSGVTEWACDGIGYSGKVDGAPTIYYKTSTRLVSNLDNGLNFTGAILVLS